MRDLGTLGGDEIATDQGLNDRGEVIGSMWLKGTKSTTLTSGMGKS